MAATMKRFVAKQGELKPRLWGVFDLSRSAWPVRLPGYGKVAPHSRDAEAVAAEADRLNDYYEKEGIPWGRLSKS